MTRDAQPKDELLELAEWLCEHWTAREIAAGRVTEVQPGTYAWVEVGGDAA